MTRTGWPGRAVLSSARIMVAGALCLLPPTAAAQRPTPADREYTTRLPKPENLVVRQAPDGAVAVSWNAVPGAKQYILGRSVGTNGYQRVLDPLAGPTLFLDRSVPVGTRVSYTVTAVDSSDIAGLRATSADFTPAAVTPTVPAGPPVVATRYGPTIEVRWTATPLTDHYEVSHILNGRIVSQDRVGLRHEFSTPATPGEHRFQVVSRPALLGTTQTRPSNPVVVEAPAPQPASADSTPTAGSGPTPAGGAPGSTTPATPAATPAPAAPSEVSLTVGSPVALRVGATAQVAAPGGSQWLTLDPAVAGVSAEGLVTARASGMARIVALTPQSAGAMRVTVVHVTVSP